MHIGRPLGPNADADMKDAKQAQLISDVYRRQALNSHIAEPCHLGFPAQNIITFKEISNRILLPSPEPMVIMMFYLRIQSAMHASADIK